MENSFVLGIDPGKSSFSASLLEISGAAQWKGKEFEMSRQGFESLTQQLPAGRLTIGIEASGRYDDNLLTWMGGWARSCGGEHQPRLLRINPGQSSRFAGARPRRNLTDGTDSAHVAEFTRVYAEQLDNFEQDPEAQGMARLMSERQHLGEDVTVLKNRFHEQLHICFPEFTRVFRDPLGALARQVVREGPTAPVMARRQALALARVKPGRRSRSLGVDRARQLIALAKRSIASATEDFDGEALLSLLDRLELLEKRQATIEARVASYVESQKTSRHPIAGFARQIELVDGVPGIGLVGAAYLVLRAAGLGRFTSGKALAAQWAVCPERVETGTSLKKSHLTCRGDHKSRAMLYLDTQMVCQNNAAFAFHKWRLVKGGLTEQQATCACMNRLARVLWSMVAHNCPYDVNRMLEQIQIHHSELWKTFVKEHAKAKKIWKKVAPKWRETA
jgi:transposase